MEYVSIRYPGTALHSGKEINGLTLGGVGSETVIDNLEVINSADDGIEAFGGNVNLKNIISFQATDDAFDYDLGYQGKIQFLLAIQKDSLGDNLIEASGAIDPVYAKPYSIPILSNMTLIGSGATSTGNVLSFDRYAGGTIVNSIFINKAKGLHAEFTNATTDCFAQFKIGNLVIANNIFELVAENVADSIFKLKGSGIDASYIDEWMNYFNNGNNEINTTGVSTSHLFPSLATNYNLFTLPTEWFEQTNFKGAFGTYDWTDGWSSYKEHL